ncbi:glycosyltransferase family protein [Leptothoe sp. PORK10 BA2]|uniref:glycosyltransferase family protein n=1 Tax=Leptothoe sp. PORK10 BA2 TaxID=3110254 RepID=UPI002B20E01C|nr:glycosyltransferase [Leptothoe sp. PORK10 BA2]MEA5466831.1 glycosyltransferase [Leptothoe sp. PORK10 BA2]
MTTIPVTKLSAAARLMVYSHDTFGLGNLRRMLAICEHLLSCWPRLSILLVSGSPMIHEFRLPKGLDYIKLPCLNRGVSGELKAKYLGTSIEETVALRSQIIASAAMHFKPDLLLVDKKPTGLKGELASTLHYLKQHLPKSRRVLLLRDILDAPQKTIEDWGRLGYYPTIINYYDQVLVAGTQSVFDLVQEYHLPLPIASKISYCGYIRKRMEQRDRPDLKAQLGLKTTDRLVLVTPGGGEDGYALIDRYLQGIQAIQPAGANRDETFPGTVPFHSLILCGPEMPVDQQLKLQALAQQCPSVIFQCFTSDLLAYIDAADAVVSMGGYNTLTEILTLGKRAVVVPRSKPSQEQLIRAARFAAKGWITMVHPDALTPLTLIQAVQAQFDSSTVSAPTLPTDDAASELIKTEKIALDGLSKITESLTAIVSPMRQSVPFLSPLCLPA